MSLKEKFETDYKSALKAKDKNKISTYRLILSGIKDLDISNRSQADKKETNDEDIKKLLKKMIKQRSESIEMYKKNNRNDLQEVEEKEVEVISQYLPKQLSDEDTKKLCSEIINSTGASSIKDMGKVMGELKKNNADNIDFSKAGAIIKELLNQKMKYPKEYLEEIKTRLKVSTVVSKTVNLKKRGKEYVGLSPFKTEKTPSFTVNDEKEFYHCFSTAEHGNIFDFVMKTQNLKFGEAVKSLANLAGMRPYTFSKEDEIREKKWNNYKSIFNKYVDHYHNELLKNSNSIRG